MNPQIEKTNNYRNLLHQIAFNETQFEKSEIMKNHQETRKKRTIIKLHSSKSLAKQLESQRFIEKLKINLEKEKVTPLKERPIFSSSQINLRDHKRNIPKTIKSTNFHLKSEYLPKQITFITQNSEFYHTMNNAGSTSLQDEMEDAYYYSKLTFENLGKLKNSFQKFNKINHRLTYPNENEGINSPKLFHTKQTQKLIENRLRCINNDVSDIIGLFYFLYFCIKKL